MKKTLGGFVGLFFVLVSIVYFLFYLGRSATEAEWSAKVHGRRTLAEMRGLLTSLSDFRSDAPNFLPQSSLDDEVCAAAITNAVNFIIGQEFLKPVPAWIYSRENSKYLEKVFDRQKDFEIHGDKIVEVKNTGFNLTKLLDPEGIYILAYHYRDTMSDAKIIKSKGDYNSHLMLLLPKDDGRWWGYHLIHYPSDSWQINPVRIEPVDILDGDKGLDLIYIARVKGIELPPEGEDLFLLNYSLHYSQIRPWLSRGTNRAMEYFIDTIVVYLLNWWNKTEQFPMIVDLKFQDIVDVPYNGKLFHGKILGFHSKNPVYYHKPGTESRRGAYGMEFQCVEYANRFLASSGHRNLTQSGHADSYFWQAKDKGLMAYANGGTVKPAVNDLLVFDGSNEDKHPGHVAVIYTVTDSYVCFSQQNVGKKWRDCLKMNSTESGWMIPGVYAPAGVPVIGWSRIQ